MSGNGNPGPEGPLFVADESVFAELQNEVEVTGFLPRSRAIALINTARWCLRVARPTMEVGALRLALMRRASRVEKRNARAYAERDAANKALRTLARVVGEASPTSPPPDPRKVALTRGGSAP